MASLRCARCGREPAPDEFDEATWLSPGLADQGLIVATLPSMGPWADIDGVVVCPQHQTPEERRDVGSRMIGTIVSAIEARSALGIDPTSTESAIIKFAMAIRARIEAPPPPLPLQVAAPLHDDGTDDVVEVRVAITSAFLTGRPLRIHIPKYDEVQGKLGTLLSDSTGRGWLENPNNGHEGGTYFSGGGFTERLPLVIARRDGARAVMHASSLLRKREEPNNLTDEGWTLTPTSLTIDVYDLGMAVMNGTFAVRPPRPMAPEDIASRLKEFVWLNPDTDTELRSPIVEMFAELAAETTREFAEAISVVAEDGTVQNPWLEPSPNDPGAVKDTSRDWGRLLWLHPVYLFEAEQPAGLESLAKRFAPTFHKVVTIKDGCFVAGVGSSSIVTTEKGVSSGKAPLHLLELHWAYFALYMEIDRGLLGVLDREGLRSDSSLRALEKNADDVFVRYIRVMEARARMHSELASLGGDEQAIWDGIAAVQNFDALVNGVEHKVKVLQRVTERRVQQASAAQARRSSRFLGFLTALTLITVTVAVITYFFGGRDGTLALVLRIAIVAVATIAAAAYCWQTFRDATPRGKKRRPS